MHRKEVIFKRAASVGGTVDMWQNLYPAGLEGHEGRDEVPLGFLYPVWTFIFLCQSTRRSTVLGDLPYIKITIIVLSNYNRDSFCLTMVMNRPR